MRIVYKKPQNKKLCGECSGLAEPYRLDAGVVRFFFTALALVWGLGLLIYWRLCVKLKEKPAE